MVATGVRKGTRVWVVKPPLNPPVNGGTCSNLALEIPPPLAGGAGGGWVSIETLRPGDLVVGHDGLPHRVLQIISGRYRGTMVGLRHNSSPQPLWLTPNHRVLCQKRTISYGAGRSWRHIPPSHFERARALRRELTPAERRLWEALRGKRTGVKFRNQHPIGPYIADFYSWEAGLVIEVDGESHYMPGAPGYDEARDAYLQALGLTVLRFTNLEVQDQTEGVLDRIAGAVQHAQPSADHYQQWRQAGSLRLGDVVYFGPERKPVEIAGLQESTAEEIYSLELAASSSYLTETCIVQSWLVVRQRCFEGFVVAASAAFPARCDG